MMQAAVSIMFCRPITTACPIGSPRLSAFLHDKLSSPMTTEFWLPCSLNKKKRKREKQHNRHNKKCQDSLSIEAGLGVRRWSKANGNRLVNKLAALTLQGRDKKRACRVRKCKAADYLKTKSNRKHIIVAQNSTLT